MNGYVLLRGKRGKNGGVRTTSNLAFNFLGRQSINVVSLELRKLTLLLLFRVLLLLSFSLPYPSSIDFFSARVVRSSLFPLSLSPSLLPIRPLVIKSFVAGMSPETLSSSSPLHSQTGTCQTGKEEREREEEDQKCPIRASIKRGEALSLLLTPFPLSSYTYVEISRGEGRVCRGKRGKDLPTAIEEGRIARDRETAEGTE